jgi:hypothetical protein
MTYLILLSFRLFHPEVNTVGWSYEMIAVSNECPTSSEQSQEPIERCLHTDLRH